MHVRVARFEGLDASQVDRDYEQFRRMVRGEERPEFIPEETLATLRDRVDESIGALFGPERSR